MSVQTLYTAATGMDAMETKLDVIANNLANINTTGFKKDRANFEDLLYRTEVYPGVQDANKTPTAVIGWGDRGFFLETPTWSDLKMTTAANALLVPSQSCLHVYLTNPQFLTASRRRVRISQQQYEQLCAFIDNSFSRDAADNYQPIPGISYSQSDAFFAANGSYHAFATCNCWVGNALRSAGVRCGWFTPLPKSVYLYLN